MVRSTIDAKAQKRLESRRSRETSSTSRDSDGSSSINRYAGKKSYIDRTGVIRYEGTTGYKESDYERSRSSGGSLLQETASMEVKQTETSPSSIDASSTRSTLASRTSPVSSISEQERQSQQFITQDTTRNLTGDVSTSQLSKQIVSSKFPKRNNVPVEDIGIPTSQVSRASADTAVVTTLTRERTPTFSQPTDRDISGFETRVARTKRAEAALNTRMERINEAAGILTFSGGKPKEERSFVGQVAQGLVSVPLSVVSLPENIYVASMKGSAAVEGYFNPDSRELVRQEDLRASQETANIYDLRTPEGVVTYLSAGLGAAIPAIQSRSRGGIPRTSGIEGDIRVSGRTSGEIKTTGTFEPTQNIPRPRQSTPETTISYVERSTFGDVNTYVQQFQDGRIVKVQKFPENTYVTEQILGKDYATVTKDSGKPIKIKPIDSSVLDVVPIEQSQNYNIYRTSDNSILQVATNDITYNVNFGKFSGNIGSTSRNVARSESAPFFRKGVDIAKTNEQVIGGSVRSVDVGTTKINVVDVIKNRERLVSESQTISPDFIQQSLTKSGEVATILRQNQVLEGVLLRKRPTFNFRSLNKRGQISITRSPEAVEIARVNNVNIKPPEIRLALTKPTPSTAPLFVSGSRSRRGITNNQVTLPLTRSPVKSDISNDISYNNIFDSDVVPKRDVDIARDVAVDRTSYTPTVGESIGTTQTPPPFFPSLTNLSIPPSLPNVPIVPIIPNLKLPKFGSSSRAKSRKKIKTSSIYTPTIAASVLDIRGEESKFGTISGFGIRPVKF